MKRPLEPKKSALSRELVGFPKKRDAQELGDENVSTGSHQVFNDILNPEFAELTNSADTKGNLPQSHTDELRHTDELCYTGELYARTRKLNEKNLRSHERPKITQKLVGASDS